MDDWSKKDRHIVFEGLRFGHDRPSDIDGILVRSDRLVVFEHKCGNKPLMPKTMMMLETLVDNAEKAGQKGVALVARYYDRDNKNDVDAAGCLVSEMYHQGKWWDIRSKNQTLREVMERFLN